jgi:cytochrome c biogenesis protein
MSAVDEMVTAPADREPSPPPGGVLTGTARRWWRQLTSMRTALILLFLLAVAAVPGSLLPQRNLNVDNVNGYLREHPALGPWLDRLWLFDVYSSPWFAAIYLLLFTSLVGCLVPRLRDHLVALARVPPDAPRRLARLPVHADGLAHDGDPAALAQALRGMLRSRRYRATVRALSGGHTVSAEKGYLKEAGNLLFHFALLGLLLGVAGGAWWGWHANRLLVAGADSAFCDTLAQYDDYGLGARVAAGDLPPFCLRLDGFHASYLDDGQPVAYRAAMSYSEGDGPWRTRRVEVNSPLRLAGADVYLLGHGYAPVVRYTDRYGRAQTTVAPFLPSDERLTSEGVAAFPDANVDPVTGTRDPRGQVAFAGVYLPTADAATGASAFPAENDPRLVLVEYVGDLGVDSGRPQSVYALNQRQIDAGRLVPVGEPHRLRVGEAWALPDGSTVEFLGTRSWVTLSVRHDPGKVPVLVAAVLLLVGLLTSLTGRRRRVWFRVAAGTVSAGGLPRTEQPGFTAEFDEIVQAAAALPGVRPVDRSERSPR